MHEAAKLRPVVIDESLTGLDRLILARELGYSEWRSKLARDTARRYSWPLLRRNTRCFAAFKI